MVKGNPPSPLVDNGGKNSKTEKRNERKTHGRPKEGQIKQAPMYGFKKISRLV
jgi:hypothetical protein